MEQELVSLKVDQNTIAAILNKKIQSAIALQLGNSAEIIGEAVSYALSIKVNNEGNISRSDYDNKYDYLEIVSTKAIHEAAKGALEEWLKNNMATVRKAVLAELKSPKRQKTLATAFADAVEESLKCSWRMDCNIDFRKIDR